MKQAAKHTTGAANPDRPVKAITSRWVVEKGRWDKTANTFVDLTSEKFERIITMTIENCSGWEILHFIGGPTGFESYDIEDLLQTGFRSGQFCICAGTINRWPACYVDSAEMFAFIQSNYKKSNHPPQVRHAS